MAEILTTKTSLAGYEMLGTFEAVRAEALFVSTLQRLGVRGCAARVAGEFGDHPDTAVARMGWALATINTVYPAPSMTPAPGLGSLAFAS